jgi:hypothetical protein
MPRQIKYVVDFQPYREKAYLVFRSCWTMPNVSLLRTLCPCKQGFHGLGITIQFSNANNNVVLAQMVDLWTTQ